MDAEPEGSASLARAVSDVDVLCAGAVTDDVRTVIVRHSVHRRHGRRRMKSHGELLLLRAPAACNAMRHRLEYASMPLEGISTGTTYVGPAVLTRHAVGHLSKGAIADFISQVEAAAATK